MSEECGDSRNQIHRYIPLPLSRLTAYGTAFQPLTTAVQTAIGGAGGSGIYYVNTGGKTMFQMKSTGNFIGSLQSPTGMVGGGQAQMTPLIVIDEKEVTAYVAIGGFVT